MKNLNDTLTEIKKAFNELNEYLFNSELAEPILVIQAKKASGRRNRNTLLGWFTIGRVWIDKETGKTNSEITVCAESFNRPLDEILEVLVHEMVHLKNHTKGINDTDSSGRYHNKEFKKAAEEALLECEYSKKYGYGLTKPTPKLSQLFSMLSIDETAFNLALEDEPELEHEVLKMFTYSCGVHLLFKNGDKEEIDLLPEECKYCKRRSFHTKAFIDAYCKIGSPEYSKYICTNEYEIEV